MGADQRRVMAKMRMHREAMRARMRKRGAAEAMMRSEACMAETARTKTTAMKTVEATAESSTMEAAAAEPPAGTGQPHSRRGQ